MNINEKLLDTLNKQVTAEHEAALIYQQLSYELSALSFDGMSTWGGAGRRGACARREDRGPHPGAR